MCKFFHSVLAAVLVVSMLTFPATALAADHPTTVLLDGEVLTTEAFIDENNRTQIPVEAARKAGVTAEYAPGSPVGDTEAVEGYLPLRTAFTEAGFTVEWDDETGRVLLRKPVPNATADMGNAPDYSKAECWYQIPEITKDVDTFYIPATEYVVSSFEEGAPDYAEIGNTDVMAGAPIEYEAHASVFEDSTNVFMPYYRQAGFRFEGETWLKTGSIDAAISGMPYDDITDALDYFFENYNNGRPFIIAGHSQGSAMTKLVLKNYFKEHPEYYERMVAAYVIGYAVTKDDLAAYPHLKFATGESDTGVIISWNTEGRKNVEENVSTAVLLPNAISINPLNWKLDDTYAPASENMGSYMPNAETGEYEITDVGADAQVVPERGVIVTNAASEPMSEELAAAVTPFLGPDGRHASDYSYFYNNIKYNVATRIAAYQSSVK